MRGFELQDRQKGAKFNPVPLIRDVSRNIKNKALLSLASTSLFRIFVVEIWLYGYLWNISSLALRIEMGSATVVDLRDYQRGTFNLFRKVFEER